MEQFVDNNSSTIDTVKTAADNAYRTFLRTIQKIKELAVELSNPEPLFEQLRVLLRDESEYWNVI